MRALEPTAKRNIVPYVQSEIGRRFNLQRADVTLISAERTFWEKALILHGIYCGFRDDNKRRPGEGNLISRHYYDVAMMSVSKEGKRAMKDAALLDHVRDHKLLMFRRGWEKLREAKLGSVHLLPQKEIQKDLRADYEAMSGMMFGDRPTFDWVMGRLTDAYNEINKKKLV